MDNITARPRISVLLPVYNAAAYLGEALASLLTQSFSNFEIIALYDESTDDSLAVLTGCRDSRLSIYLNKERGGLASILNKGLDMAKGEFIARMDSDDVCHPHRFARQVAFLESHPEIGICGTWYRPISPTGEFSGRAARLETDPRAVHSFSFFRSRLAHPTIMMRSTMLQNANLRYDPSAFAEDYDFWVRAFQHCQVANLPEFLLYYRKHPAQLSNLHDKAWGSTKQIRARLLSNLGINADEEDLELHQMICTSETESSADFLPRIDLWLCRIKNANDALNIYPEPYFSHALIERWMAMTFIYQRKHGPHPTCFLSAAIVQATDLGLAFQITTIANIATQMVADRIHNLFRAAPTH